VSINHIDGFSTRYMHMTHYIVYPGQYVAQGQVIGYCGSTGASSGPHLHFGVYYNGVAVNPAKYINIS
jgi:murein DD-endopeptidase MepM/ murein hydrolase activator NlpD